MRMRKVDMNLRKYPEMSSKFREMVMRKHTAQGCDLEGGLALVDAFLEQHPFYPEALLFKARMLIGLSKDEEALDVLEASERIDEWRTAGLFDKAEIQFRSGQKAEAIQIVQNAIERSLKELIDGVENFLLGIDFDVTEMKVVSEKIREEMVSFLTAGGNSMSLESVRAALLEHAAFSESADK